MRRSRSCCLQPLLAEYRAVLLRPHLAKLHGLSEPEVDTILTDLAQHAPLLEANHQHTWLPPDPGDQFLWDLLATRAHLVRVSGDMRLLNAPGMASRVMSPGALVDAELRH